MLDRTTLKQHFNANHLVVFPVIHVLDNDQASRNIAIAKEAGCAGVFLINHDFAYEQFLPIIRHCREQFPHDWIGVNFLAVTGRDAFPILATLQQQGTRVDGYWADDARIDESAAKEAQTEAQEILQVKARCGWNGMYFGGTAFKKQREVAPADYARSATLATGFMDVVTTSGIATGHSADLNKIQTFRDACGEHPLALASGITPDNITEYLPAVDAVLVATGINHQDDFYNIDPQRLARLMEHA